MKRCDVAVAVVGAGPHGLTIASQLVDRWPELARDLVVFDPSGGWLDRWKRQFRAHQIPTLRSPGVHHPHPDPYALTDFATEEGRTGEMGEYGIPSTALFDDLCAWVVAEYELTEVVVPVAVSRLEPEDGAVVLHLSDGARCRARRVVLAHNPQRRRLPPWVEALGGRHADDVDLGCSGVGAGSTVTVVGGGLTAAHLAVGAASRGGVTRLLSRRALRAQLFDTDPGWQGPKELAGYHALADHDHRRTAIDAARDGGSIPLRWLDALRASGVEMVVDQATAATLAADPPTVLWAATGSHVDATTDPLLAGLFQRHRTDCHDGLPALTADLRWPGTSVHLMGAYAGLHVGPVARNLAGARHSAGPIAGSVANELGLAWADSRHERQLPRPDRAAMQPHRAQGAHRLSGRAARGRAISPRKEPNHP